MDECINARILVQDMILNFPVEREGEQVLVFLNQQAAEVKRFTFLELKEECIRTAHRLVTEIPRGEVVLLPIEAQADFVIGFFACLLAGCVPAPLSPIRHKRDRTGIDRMLGILKTGSVNTLLVEDSQKAMMETWLANESFGHVKVISLKSEQEAPSEKATLPTDISADDLAYIQYTSGSTSDPKGVMLSHKQVIQNLTKMYRVFERPERVRVVGWLPFYHDMGLVGHLFTVLYESGFGAFLPPSSFLASPHLWFESLHKYEGTACAAPTFALEMSLRKVRVSPEWNLNRFKHLYVGSETVTFDVLQNFSQKFATTGFDPNDIKPVYGLAESTLLVAGGGKGFTEINDHFLNRTAGSGNRMLTPYKIDTEVGSIQIKDPDSHATLPEGQEGEIFIEAPFNSTGYYGLETMNPSGNDGAVIATGDIGFVKDGYLYLSGRRKEIIIVRGVNYNAEDLEFAIQHNQAAFQSEDLTACIADIGPEKERLVVFQEVHRHTAADLYPGIVESIQANLTEGYGITADAIHLIPRGMMPKTPNHKISRAQCLSLYKEGKLTSLYTAESTSAPPTGVAAEDPIVVVGMACRFPGGANSPEAFWENLIDGVDGISEIPYSRWDNKIFYDRKIAVPGRMNTKWSGLTEDIDLFDPQLFGISPYEAPEIDPQHRMLLETSWRLMENTGWRKEDMVNSDTGVFVGIANNDYLYLKIKLTPDMNSFNAYSGLGNSNSVAANRLSYFYDLKGPSLAVDTACSSSLTAFHLGVQAIQQGDCKQAIVGGVNAILSPGTTITLSQFGMMSPVGRCKAFDSGADGYVRSEGCGLVMLKKQSEALKDGDQILAVIKGSATGQDGHSHGMTYPNGAAQHKLISRTLGDAGMEGKEISYMEAHGTGTPTGDPVEMEQLARLYGGNGQDKCYVGSVKANIGHLETAAGVAGLIKVVLMLQKKQIPPQIHMDIINPRIHLEDTRLEIPTEKRAWSPKSDKRTAAISSFGFGGSLAHAILEEPEDYQQNGKALEASDKNPSPLLFPLSAHTAQGLKKQAQQWVDWLERETEISMRDMVYTQAIARSHLKYQQAFIVQDKADLKSQLERYIKTAKKPIAQPDKSIKTCFLFSGQGEQFPQMGKTFYQEFPVFKKAFDRCAEAVADQLPGPLAQIAFDESTDESLAIKYLQVTQFAIQYALGTLWQECGIIPEVMLGHSLGEYAAACLAGCFDPETGTKILLKRVELVDGLSEKGKMATLFTNHEAVAQILNPERAQVAAVNSLEKTVISGESKELARVIAHFAEKGVEGKELPIHVAFHSHLLDPILDEFYEYLRQFDFSRPLKRWISATTGREVHQAPGADHWVNHLRHTVQFVGSVQLLEQEEISQFIEIGPGANALLSLRECSTKADLVLLRSLGAPKGKRTESYPFLDSLGKLYQNQQSIHWQTIIQGTKRPTQVPGVVFNHQSYWVKGLEAENIAAFAGPIYQKDYKAPTPQVNGQKIDASIHYDLAWVDKGSLSPLEEIEEVRSNLSWIVLGADSPLLQALLEKIKKRGQQVFWLGMGDKLTHKPYAVLDHDTDAEKVFGVLNKIVTSASRANVEGWKVIYLDKLNETSGTEPGIEEIKTKTQNSLGVFIPFLKALNRVVITPPLWVVTDGSQQVEVSEGARLNLVAAPLWGFAKTLYLEHPECRGGMIDLETGGEPDQLATQLVSKVLKPGSESCIAIRQGTQFVEQLVPGQKQISEPQKFRDDGAFIITGGLGGLGLETASWVVEKGARHLILISRRKLPDHATWQTLESDHPQKAVIDKLRLLEEKGAKVEVVSLDICDMPKLEDLFSTLEKREVPVRGILHAAGQNWFSKILELDAVAFFKTLDIKVAATWALHKLSKAHDLDCFILYSSISALWGSVNLSHYTAANFFMDSVSLYRAGTGQKSLSINWGPWDEVGMSAQPEERVILDKMGFSLIPPQEALQAMERELSANKALSLVSRIDWTKYKLFIDFTLQPSLFEQVAKDALPSIYENSTDHLDYILQATPEKARELIEEVVRTELRSIMLLESVEDIPDDKRFNFLGMDSLMAILLATKLEEYFQVKLPNTLAYNYPHIRAVSDRLLELVYGVAASEATSDTEQVAEAEEDATEETEDKVPIGSWFKLIKEPEGQTDITLYCFPYAGSGPETFQSWSSIIHPGIKLVGIQPPGKGNRVDEKSHTSMVELVEDLVNNFIPPEGPYAFYGHSLGALIAYETFVALQQSDKQAPNHLFVSGSNAPRIREDRIIHELPQDEFINIIVEKYEDDSMDEERRLALERTIDELRADFQVLETYQPSNETVWAPMMVIAGESDTLMSAKKLRKWALLSEKDFGLHYIPGGHNLVNEQQSILVNLIEGQLSDYWSDDITLVLDEFANAD